MRYIIVIRVWETFPHHEALSIIEARLRLGENWKPDIMFKDGKAQMLIWQKGFIPVNGRHGGAEWAQRCCDMLRKNYPERTYDWDTSRVTYDYD